jgi:hypothetical protein
VTSWPTCAVAVETPVLQPVDRPAPDLPTFADLERWDILCRWLDVQPDTRTRLPILGVPKLGDVPSAMLRDMRKYRLVRHGEDCTWRLSPTWKERLLELWHGVVRAEGECEPHESDAPIPYSVAAGIDTWYLNRLDESGLPSALRMALDDLQIQAKDEDDEVETPWEYDGVPLSIYRTGVNSRQGGGVSWAYILRNPSLALLVRKTPLGGVIAQARLGSECLWRRTPLGALNEVDLLVRRMWRMGSLGRRGRVAHQAGRWQVSQAHFAHDVAHAPLEIEQLGRYVSRSRKRALFELARADLRALYAGLEDSLGDGADLFLEGGLDWDALYDDDLDGYVDPFAPDGLDDFGDSFSAQRDRAKLEAIRDPELVEERAMSAHQWGHRLSGVTWSPGAAVSFVAYDKVLEGKLRGKGHMEPIWKANGWDGKAPVTRHEARLRRDVFRALSLDGVDLDDPWVMLNHQHELFAYIVGRPPTAVATDCPQPVDVAWIRRVVPAPAESNRSRWPTDPTWAVVQSPSFQDAPAEVRRLIRRKVRSHRIEKRDQGAYGLLVSRTALAFADPKHWNLEYGVRAILGSFEEETQKPGKAFHELVRRRRRAMGLPVPAEERVVSFRSSPSASLPALDLLIDQDQDDKSTNIDDSGQQKAQDATEASRPSQARILALLRTERRLEELEQAIQEAPKTGQNAKWVQQELGEAYEHELHTYDLLKANRPEWA